MTTSSRTVLRRQPRWAMGLILAALVVVPACSKTIGSTASSSPTTTNLAGHRSGASTTTSEPTGTTLTWHSCADAPEPFECATLDVPIDHKKPNGATLGLALVKLPATDQAHKIGPLLVNPGGPGGSGIEFVEGNLWSPTLTRRFDLIGFDPRGIGQSDPIECGEGIEKMYSVDPAPTTPAAVIKLEAVSKAYVQECAKRNTALLPHMSTRDVAADMDDIRRALGVTKINYLGYSYGTSIGQVYADLYPTHIRAMVLDGVVRLGQSGLDAATDQGVAFDKVLGTFFTECATDPSCRAGSNAQAMFNSVRARLRIAPMPTTLAGRTLTIGEFHLGVGQALYDESYWPLLGQALAQAAGGNGTDLLQLADQYLGRNSDGTYSNQTNGYFAVSCLDWDWPSDPNRYLEAGRAVAARSPFLAEGIVTDYIRCAYWPTRPRPLTPPVAKGSPLIVVVSTTNDPATPYSNGVDLAKQLPEGALITKVGNDHTAYGRGDQCVDDAVNAYLISLRPPARNLRCN